MTWTTPNSAAGHPHTAGTLVDEAGQLLDVVAARLAGLKNLDAAEWSGGRPAADPVDQRAGPDERAEDIGGAHTEPNSGGTSPQCVGWCPICRSAELLHGDRPELTAKLVDAALLVVTTLRSLLPPTGDSPATNPAPDGTNPAQDSAGSPRPGIERIDIR